MKKILVLLSLLVCILVLVSCEHTHEKGTKYASNDTHHWFPCEDEECDMTYEKATHVWDAGTITEVPTPSQDGVKSYLCKVCRKVKQESVKYEPTPTVSQFQWNGAFAKSRFSNVTTVIEEIIRFEGNSHRVLYNIQADGSLLYLTTQSYKENEAVKYSAKYQEGNLVWNFTGLDQKIEDITPEFTIDIMNPSAVITDYGFYNLKDCFDSFTYNSEKKCYEASNLKAEGNTITYKDISIKMGDGQILKIIATIVGNPEMEIIVDFSAYGTTNPTPPRANEQK